MIDSQKDMDSSEKTGSTIRENSQKMDVGRLLQFAQIVVLAVSGCWALYQFTTFTSESQKLQLTKAQIEIENNISSQKLADTELKMKNTELRYADALAELQVQKTRQETLINEIEMKYADAKQTMEIQKAIGDSTSKEHELRKEIATIYDRIIELTKNFIQLKHLYEEKKTQDNYYTIEMLKSALDLQKDNFINLESKLAKMEKRDVRKIRLEFILPAPPQNLKIMSISP